MIFRPAQRDAILKEKAMDRKHGKIRRRGSLKAVGPAIAMTSLSGLIP
jgi:hypothetical protein